MGVAMPRVCCVLAVPLLAAAPALSQTDEPFAAPKPHGFEIEALVRHEWTQKIFVSPTETRNEDRWRLRLLPRINAGGDRFKVTVGGDFNYDPDGRNTRIQPADPEAEPVKPGLLRDNYDSRSARLDLAHLHFEPLSWMHLDLGRFPMPPGLTEMLWDKDLRPQGGALKISTRAIGDIEGLSLMGLVTQGGHVFDDGDARLILGTASAKLKPGEGTGLELAGSYLHFTKLGELEPMIRRQNLRVTGTPDFLNEFRVADIIVRMKTGGNMPMQFVADYAWNTAADEQNRGIWLAVVLGSLNTSRARLEYVYARVDRDVTVAAFATDDFFWATGWEGHKIELASRSGPRVSGHLIAQLQRFKDGPPAEQEHWIRRFRTEVRLIP
jgi:hypothetical protein